MLTLPKLMQRTLMNIFDYHDYKLCVNDWISEQKRGGHGQFRQLSLQLRINSVVMSQVFRGNRELTLEQAVGVTNYMSLTEMERDFFLLLVQKARAGTHELRQIIEEQIETLRTTSQALKNRIKHQKFTDEDKAIFYSQWYYSAIRLGLSIPSLSSASSIADYLNLDELLVARVINFLLKHKLVIEKDGQFDLGPQVTHIGHDSPLVNRHHYNWRLKSLQTMEKSNELNLHYTGPMALSQEASKKIRKQILEFVEKSTKIAANSPSETLRCLNIDWYDVHK